MSIVDKDLAKDNPFRNSNNRYLTKAMFFETSHYPESIRFTLKLHDHKGYPSLHRLYVDMEDPTEYLFAIEYFEGWEHWKVLSSLDWFKPYLENMREELDLKLKAKNVERMKKVAEDPDHKSSVQAMRYLIEKGYIDKDEKIAKKRGRPSKDEIEGNLKRMSEEELKLAEDFRRVTGEVIN